MDGHTGERGRRERGEGVTVSSAYQEKPTKSSHLAHKFTERNPWILPIRSLRIDREQLVPESSNHSFYLMNLFIFSNLEESAHTTNTNTNTKTQTPTQQTQTPTQHTHAPTHTHQPTDPPNTTLLSSLPFPSPPHTHTQTHMYMHVYFCMCVYMHM